MKKKAELTLLALACSGLALPSLATAGGFVEDSTATLTARNYYFSRDFSDIVGPNKQSKAEEWAQGFILNVKSGYTQGTVGFGIDAIGQLGIKLDSSKDRVNTGLLPVQDDGEAADEYSRLGAALKVKLSKTELKVGELQPNLPVLTFSDIRLLPPSYQGASIVSQEFAGLTLQGGHLNTTSLRDEAGDDKIRALIPTDRAYVPTPTSDDGFSYVGADYVFNQNRTSVGAWYAQLEDIYAQNFFSLKHSQPVGAWTLGANLGYFDSAEDGDELAGEIDNQAFYTQLFAKRGGHNFLVGYQAMSGEHGLPRIFANVTPLGNEVPTFEFAAPDERSWQVRYDYDFAALGIPGLVSTVRYLTGDNVDTGSAEEGKDWERDLDLGYTVQSGPLKNFSVRVRNVTARSNYRPDIDENRLILSYSLALF
jgi:hypothetical protein